MTLSALKKFALSFPHTTWVKQWGECLVYKVEGKMFLLVSLDGETVEGVVFKCTPEEFDALTENEAIVQAPYCAKRHWVKVLDTGAVGSGELKALITRSRDLVIAKLPKKTQAKLPR